MGGPMSGSKADSPRASTRPVRSRLGTHDTTFRRARSERRDDQITASRPDGLRLPARPPKRPRTTPPPPPSPLPRSRVISRAASARRRTLPRGKAPLAPEKGVFPLDHFGECRKVMLSYLACLKKHGQDASPCRDLSRGYLECRMERELMAKQPLEELGFGAGAGDGETTHSYDGEKERGGDEGAGGGWTRRWGGGGSGRRDAGGGEREREKPSAGHVGGMRYVEAGKKLAAEARRRT